jgi:hypothetical protein
MLKKEKKRKYPSRSKKMNAKEYEEKKRKEKKEIKIAHTFK